MAGSFPPLTIATSVLELVAMTISRDPLKAGLCMQEYWHPAHESPASGCHMLPTTRVRKEPTSSIAKQIFGRAVTSDQGRTNSHRRERLIGLARGSFTSRKNQAPARLVGRFLHEAAKRRGNLRAVLVQ